MVISNKVYSAVDFLEEVTGKYYILKKENTVEEIEKLLEENGYSSGEWWNFSLIDTDEALRSGNMLVLVDCSGFYDGQWREEFRWFEIP